MRSLPMIMSPQVCAEAFLEEEILRTIPLSRAMQLHVHGYTADALALTAPLGPNSNDKGCAFGGSMASLMTLACWGLARLTLRDYGFEPDIFVQDSHIEYLAPVWGDLYVRASAADDESLADFVSRYAARGKARSTLVASIEWEGQTAARLTARFVAKRRQENTE